MIMKKISKVLVTVIVVSIWMLIFGSINIVRSEAGAHTPGIFALILFVALIGAIRAIWKKQSDVNLTTSEQNQKESDNEVKTNASDDKYMLQK